MTARPILLVGVGNEWRGDDGVGPWIIEQFQALDLPGVTTIRNVADGLALLDVWRNAGRVYVFDALRHAAIPGEVLRVDALHETLPVDLARTSHAFGLADAIELGRTLSQLPEELIVIGIEGRQFELGSGLSMDVEIAAGRVVEALREELLELISET